MSCCGKATGLEAWQELQPGCGGPMEPSYWRHGLSSREYHEPNLLRHPPVEHGRCYFLVSERKSGAGSDTVKHKVGFRGYSGGSSWLL